jgi:signal transduction histidine kinase
VAAALQRVADEVEDVHAVNVESVQVGDCPIDDRLTALVAASREALSNAARHSGAKVVSAYLEVEPHQVTVFVRDRGCGFDPEDIPPDRHGIAESILGRLSRNGGKAAIRSQPGEGTEVELVMSR